MTEEEFLICFQNVLQREEPLQMERQLQDLPEWDSLAVLSTCLFLNENSGKSLAMQDLANLKTVADVFTLLRG